MEISYVTQKEITLSTMVEAEMEGLTAHRVLATSERRSAWGKTIRESGCPLYTAAIAAYSCAAGPSAFTRISASFS